MVVSSVSSSHLHNVTPALVSQDHYDAMSEVHRRIAPSCVSPSLNWHLALWPEPNFRASSDLEIQNERRKEWIEKLNQFLESIEETVTSGNSESRLCLPVTDSESDLRKARFVSLQGQHGDHKFTWKIKIEAHFEFVTITVFLSVQNVDQDSQLDISDDSESECAWPLFLEHLPPSKVSLAISQIESCDHSETQSKLNGSVVYEDVWNSLLEAVTQQAQLSVSDFGRIFADIRSVVVDLPDESTSSKLPFRLNNPPMHIEDEVGIDICEQTARQLAVLYKQLVGGIRRKEYVCCGMLRYRAIYISTLGARDDVKYKVDGNPNAVKFLLVNTTNSDKYQVGRLVERLNSIGVSRLAALKDLERIRNIGRRVQAMGLRMDELTLPREPDMEKLQDLLVQLNNLGREGDEETTIVDGAPYRLMRSQYYSHIVESRVPDLGIRRIEGWQPYDEFLRRRLYPVFRFIKDVDRRIENLRGRINSITWIVETRTSRNILASSEEIMKNRNDQIDAQGKLEAVVRWLTYLTVMIGIIQIGLALIALG